MKDDRKRAFLKCAICRTENRPTLYFCEKCETNLHLKPAPAKANNFGITEDVAVLKRRLTRTLSFQNLVQSFYFVSWVGVVFLFLGCLSWGGFGYGVLAFVYYGIFASPILIILAALSHSARKSCTDLKKEIEEFHKAGG